MSKKKEIKEFVLKNWSIIADPLDSYQAPELISMRAQGEVYGNPKFEDGVRITTSSIQKVVYDEDNIPTQIITDNSTYRLENILQSYKTYLESIREK